MKLATLGGVRFIFKGSKRDFQAWLAWMELLAHRGAKFDE
jgi:hypothetical protein